MTYHKDELRIRDLEARVDILESFIMRNFDWDSMLVDSNLEETIVDTVKHKFWVSVNAEFREK